MSSTASSTQRRSAGTRSSTDSAAGTPVAAGVRRTHRRSGAARSSPISEPREGFLRGGRNVEEGGELRKLAERAGGCEVGGGVVSVGEEEGAGGLLFPPGARAPPPRSATFLQKEPRRAEPR